MMDDKFLIGKVTPATYNVGSDAYGGVVVRTSKTKAVFHWAKWKGGNAHDMKDLSGEMDITLRKNGRWVPVGMDQYSGGPVSIGVCTSHRDPHF